MSPTRDPARERGISTDVDASRDRGKLIEVHTNLHNKMSVAR